MGHLPQKLRSRSAMKASASRSSWSGNSIGSECVAPGQVPDADVPDPGLADRHRRRGVVESALGRHRGVYRHGQPLQLLVGEAFGQRELVRVVLHPVGDEPGQRVVEVHFPAAADVAEQPVAPGAGQ